MHSNLLRYKDNLTLICLFSQKLTCNAKLSFIIKIKKFYSRKTNFISETYDLKYCRLLCVKHIFLPKQNSVFSLFCMSVSNESV